MMLLAGHQVHLIQKRNMHALRLILGGSSHTILLESSLLSKKPPRLLYVARQSRKSTLVLEGCESQYIITIIHKTNALMFQTLPIPSTVSLDSLLNG
ncbi:non-structural protein [Parker's Farm virus]|nr:non-structural protein [Parker's Farm virus]